MNCPACSSTEFDGNGLCLSCGRTAEAQSSAPAADGAGSASTAEKTLETPPNAAPDVPEWRQELSRRLQEIKSKREAAAAAAQERPAPASEASDVPVRPGAPRRNRRMTALPSREREPVAEAIALPDGAAPLETASAGIDRRNAIPMPASETPLRPPDTSDTDPQEIRNLIDSVMSRYPQIEGPADPAPVPASAPTPEVRTVTSPSMQRKLEFASAAQSRPTRKPDPVPDPEISPSWMLFAHEDTALTPAEPGEDKLILLSRTLAGLVDLIIIILCAGGIMFTVDILEGIEIWDAVSKFHYGLLFMATYFLYSFFFLTMANQTIGMMLTDLRLVDGAMARAGAMQVVVRCLLFPFSVGLLGIGLVWGCFDRRVRCLHDLLSGTRVTRVRY